jgi:hypothetical protein
MKHLLTCATMLLAVIGLLHPVAARAHGGLSMDKDMCRLRVGAYNIHFVGYQPERTAEQEFCEDIPETGPTVVVLDYIDHELRGFKTEVRIIRDTGSEADLDAITVLHVPPQVYPAGSLHFEHTFDEPGKFIGLVTVAANETMVARFPFSVGRNNNWWQMLLPFVLVGVGGAVLYLIAMRRHDKKAREQS